MSIFEIDNHVAEPNKKNKMDGLQLLSELKSGCIKTAFFDPQYRGVLDKLSYGNEGKGRGKARSALTQMPEETIVSFIHELNRALTPSGHLFLWVDKFHLCQGVLGWLKDTQLNLVDMIVWDKEKNGDGVSQSSKIRIPDCTAKITCSRKILLDRPRHSRCMARKDIQGASAFQAH